MEFKQPAHLTPPPFLLSPLFSPSHFFTLTPLIPKDDLSAPARLPPPPGPSAAAALAAAASTLAAALAPPTSALERRLRADAEGAASSAGPCARAVARALAKAGWAARTRDALPAPPSVKGKAVFEHLRHAFVVVHVGGGGGGGGGAGAAELVVDAAFGDAFAVRNAPPAFAALAARLPATWVGPAPRLEALVAALGAALEACFADAGVSLPPWRSARALLSKWRPSAWLDGPAPGQPAATAAHHPSTPPLATGASPPMSPGPCALGCCDAAAAVSPPGSPLPCAAATPPAALGMSGRYSWAAVPAAPPPTPAALAGRPARPPPVPVPAAAAAEAAGRSLLSSRLARVSVEQREEAAAVVGLLAAQLTAPVRQVKMVGAPVV